MYIHPSSGHIAHRHRRSKCCIMIIKMKLVGYGQLRSRVWVVVRVWVRVTGRVSTTQNSNHQGSTTTLTQGPQIRSLKRRAQIFRRRSVNTLADRVSRVADSDWIIASVLRMISGAVFHILGICDGGAPSEKTTGTKEKMQI